MRINEVLSTEGVLGNIGNKIGNTLSGVGQTFAQKAGVGGATSFKQALLSKGLGMISPSAQAAYNQNNAIGDYNYANASDIIKKLGIKPGIDFEINPGEKVKITKVDGTGATYMDRRSGLPLQLGKDALIGIAQRQQQAMQTAQMGKPGATNAPATAPTM
jgi:hypothetical protein